MPDYEYRCLDCRNRFLIFMTFVEYGQKAVQCPKCQSIKVERRIGRVRFARSEESRLENMADNSSLDGLEEDPRALGKIMRKMSREVGEEMGPEFNEVIGRLEAGQSPEDIEKEIPDLGGAEGTGGMPGGMGMPGGLPSSLDDY